jgi:enamine deaminase RidA (YjgF/YER057c/UK114 family)
MEDQEDTPMTSFVNPQSVHAPTGYSHSAVVPAGTELIFLSGQVGIKPDGSVPSTLEEQSVQMFNNIGSLLSAHGLDPSSIVKLTLFVVAGQDIRVVRSARAQLLGDHKPTSTAVFISQLVDPKLLVECEAIAARPAK